MSSLSTVFADKEGTNWLKAWMAVDIAKSRLEEFSEPQIEELGSYYDESKHIHFNVLLLMKHTATDEYWTLITKACDDQYECIEDGFGTNCECFVVYVPAALLKEKEEMESEREKDKKFIEELQKQRSKLLQVIAKKEAQQKLLEVQLNDTKLEKDQKHEEALRAREDVLANCAELMRTELQCSICSELFIKPTSLNCSHSFCWLCIQRWMKEKKECPNCCMAISTHMRSLVLDNCIEKMVEQFSVEMKKRRQELVHGRKVEEEEFEEVNPDPEVAAEVDLSDSDDVDMVDEMSSDSLDDSYSNSDSDLTGDSEAYYEGYGRCATCDGFGHHSLAANMTLLRSKEVDEIIESGGEKFNDVAVPAEVNSVKREPMTEEDEQKEEQEVKQALDTINLPPPPPGLISDFIQSAECYIIPFQSGKRVSEVLPLAERAFGRSAKPILIYCNTTSHVLFVFKHFNIDELLLEPLAQSKVEACSHVFLMIDHVKTSLFSMRESLLSKLKFLLEKQDLLKRSISYDDLLHLSSKGVAGQANIESHIYTSATERKVSYVQATVILVTSSGNTFPLPAKMHHPVLSNHTCTVEIKDESLNTNHGDNDWSLKRDQCLKKSNKHAKQYLYENRCTFEDVPLQNENMVTNFVTPVRELVAIPARTPSTNVTNTLQEVQIKQGVYSNMQKNEKKKFISEEYFKRVCNKIKKKYLKPQTKKLVHAIRKLTTIPRKVRNCILTVFPARRPGKSGKNRNQNSPSSRPSPQVPIQASDATERDRNRPLVTSTTPVFSTGGSGTPTNPIPTTNLMDLDNERILRDRLRGVGNTVQVAPRYPEYADQTVRQRTFANWPTYTQQQSARLIIFGFYYTGQADLVRCFQCGIGLKDWSPGDEPLFEHVRHSPNCPFLQQLLGDELLGTYRDNLAEAQQRNETATSHGLNIQAPQTTRPRTVRHPDRATMPQRLETFSGWPHTNGQPPQRLAEAGLFYTGTNDLCRCFTCDGGLQRWDKDDDPWLEHARWFPHCTYVREVKGQDYINLVLAAAEQAMREDEESVVIQGLSSRDLQTTDPMATPEARSVIEMGYSRTAVQLAIHEYNGKNPTKGALSFNAGDLVQILVGRQERGEEIPQDLPSEELGATGSSQQAGAADPIVENRRLKGILKCLSCKENDCNMLLLPCTHHRLCEDCAQNVTHCPVCGRKVEDKVRTFMS